MFTVNEMKVSMCLMKLELMDGVRRLDPKKWKIEILEQIAITQVVEAVVAKAAGSGRKCCLLHSIS